MAFILFHAKLQLPSIIIVDVTAVGVIHKVGLMFPPDMGHCALPPSNKPKMEQNGFLYLINAIKKKSYEDGAQQVS